MKTMIIVGIVFAWTALAVAHPSGETGRTLKSTTAGCGSCHGSSANNAVSVSISGPASVAAGQSASFTVTVTHSTGTKCGVDIAVRRGTLAPVSSTIKSSGGELVHKAGVTLPATFDFTYTAPATAGTDSVYVTAKGAGFSDWNWAQTKPLTITTLTAVDNDNALPASFALLENFPNPFNPTTTISYTIPAAAHVHLAVYDLAGQQVALLVDENRVAGEHTVRFDASGLSSGVYLSVLRSGDILRVRKMVLTR